MMLSNNQSSFNQDWLQVLQQDPVQPISEKRNLHRRCEAIDRRVFVAVEDNNPLACLQVALTKHTVSNIDELWGDIIYPPFNTAIFYSVFKVTEDQQYSGIGQTLILHAAQYLKELHPSLMKFVTMSPIPSLTKKFAERPAASEVLNFVSRKADAVARFHINNGATVANVWEDADVSELRQQQSWGFMASYDYSSAV